MQDEGNMKINVQNDIREMAKLIGLPSIKYRDEPLLNEAQKVF